MRHFTNELLTVNDIVKHFPIAGSKKKIHAVDGVSFELYKGETLSIVGESGCGKSTLARLCIRLLEATSGSVDMQQRNLNEMSKKELRKARREMQLVFQDPFASLNPRRTIAQTLIEPLAIHGIGTAEERQKRLNELLNIVGLEPEMASRYPHEFSGGQRQRIGIARAIALEPKLVVLDEPVSALDVSIQAQILNLLVKLREEMGLSYLFISHDLAVVKHISDRVAVMYLGQIVEISRTDILFDAPLHPYTQTLLQAIPRVGIAKEKVRTRLTGDVPDPSNPPKGCRFSPRCPKAMSVCFQEMPLDRNTAQEGSPRHYVKCHLYR